jgi:predicted CoA-substrate-specific enzyme activase
MTYSLGLDIGSVSVKSALINEKGQILKRSLVQIKSNPQRAVNELLANLRNDFNLDQISSAGVSGVGSGVIPKNFGWVECSSSLAIVSGVIFQNQDTRTIISVGGQSSQVITLENGLKTPWNVVSNPLCAAGTGKFIEQQAYRLGIDMSDFARLALACEGNPPRIATRCSVFAKTDLIHLQQKGVPIETLLYALCEGIARLIISLKKGAFKKPIYFVGGVAGNNAIVKALNNVLTLRNECPTEIFVPEDFIYMQSLGSALLSRGRNSKVEILTREAKSKSYFKLAKLQEFNVSNDGTTGAIPVPSRGYLGVDVGSTSTKAVILDESGKKILAKRYLMTLGRPIDAVKEVFSYLLKDGALKVDIAGVGVTGSGRYLIGSLIGADLIKNEITAQTRAAVEIDPQADIIEIGGQDSKLIIKRNGIVVDYQMNKACAAGTGSFIDELAEMLGVSVKNGDFAKLAFSAPYTIDLGTRCAAFMGQAVTSAQQEDVSLDIITASLADAIAKNYLSKIISNRKLGDNIILTGAVFYNKAIISAFNKLFAGKNLVVAEHREVSGAIGAALLAKELMSTKNSDFKGFEEVIQNKHDISTFTCTNCDNNCAITRMKTSANQITFYGSRCDRYDSTIDHEEHETYFDEREDLLFGEFQKDAGKGITIGIPRALLVYDYAPMLIGFLNMLDVKVVLSGKTNKETIERSMELSYSESCFPLKLLYAHISKLENVDYILYPSFMRLGIKEENENQQYTCPLIQASPYVVSRTLDLSDKMLIPVVDLSSGNKVTIKNLARMATQMGFCRRKGIQAAQKALEIQQKFEKDRKELGKKLLKKVRRDNKLGVVLLTRSYLSQDSGANLGIAEKLSQLGVTPIPLDFLPLDSINPKEYSDRPYWSYESKFIAATAITRSHPQLYGLVITNFGCGPNSFILNLMQDIMGEKPLGQIEIDEHAAEAGITTRLEAFVDTIEQYAQSTRESKLVDKDIRRGLPVVSKNNKSLLIPRMAPHADLIAAAMQAFGVNAIVLPEPDERNILFSNQVTSGTECLPYRVTLGDFLRFCSENSHASENIEGFMSGSFGPCRLGKYALEQTQVLKNMGFNLPIRISVSNNAYRDWNLGTAFERLAWKGILAVDYLQKLLWRTKPYEKQKGVAGSVFNEYMKKIEKHILRRQSYGKILEAASYDFAGLIDPNIPRKPLIGINGEIYLRTNSFSNNNMISICEEAGLEVSVSPISEWFNYTSLRNLEDAVSDRDIKKAVRSYISNYIQRRDDEWVAKFFPEELICKEPLVTDLLAKTNRYLSSKCGTEAVLSIGSGIHWMENSKFAGVISVMPHGCMPGGIVAAMSDSFSKVYKKPWISLTFDGFQESNNSTKINEFAELVKFCSQETT